VSEGASILAAAQPGNISRVAALLRDGGVAVIPTDTVYGLVASADGAAPTERLYALKGRIVASGIKAITGIGMPTFRKRRFQHGATSERTLRRHLPASEAAYRNRFLALYA